MPGSETGARPQEWDGSGCPGQARPGRRGRSDRGEPGPDGAGVCWESASQCWHDQAMERSSITSVIGIIEALVCAAELSVVVGGRLLGVG